MHPTVHFSSNTAEWETPQALFDKLHTQFQFTLDVCATPENAKCPTFYTLSDDGLTQPWVGVCWMNPPYGRGIGSWLRKAYESSLVGATVVCLIPASTSSVWWHDYAMKGHVHFIRGRLKFGGAKVNAPFSSAIVVFSPPKKTPSE